jgi:hypothetical protein
MKRAVLLLLMLGMSPVQAGTNKPPSTGYVKWQEECSSCHVAYPPHMLSPENWQSLMGGLDKHFGSNAVLDARDNKKILGFLQRYAGSGDRYAASSLRISDTPWFRREHRSIAAKEWTNPDVRSRSNCSACHGKNVLGG